MGLRMAEDALQALRNSGPAITPSGRVSIVGRVIDDSRLSPLGAVGFNPLALHSFDAGGTHTERAHREWLTAVGFAEIARVPLAEGVSIMAARKPV
jgi:hypothetical protein